MIDNDNKQISLNNAVYTMPKTVETLCKKIGFTNYRIVIADPEN
jgi:hypothetical protein